MDLSTETLGSIMSNAVKSSHEEEEDIEAGGLVSQADFRINLSSLELWKVWSDQQNTCGISFLVWISQKSFSDFHCNKEDWNILTICSMSGFLGSAIKQT